VTGGKWPAQVKIRPRNGGVKKKLKKNKNYNDGGSSVEGKKRVKIQGEYGGRKERRPEKGLEQR